MIDTIEVVGDFFLAVTAIGQFRTCHDGMCFQKRFGSIGSIEANDGSMGAQVESSDVTEFAPEPRTTGQGGGATSGACGARYVVKLIEDGERILSAVIRKSNEPSAEDDLNRSIRERGWSRRPEPRAVPNQPFMVAGAQPGGPGRPPITSVELQLVGIGCGKCFGMWGRVVTWQAWDVGRYVCPALNTLQGIVNLRLDRSGRGGIPGKEQADAYNTRCQCRWQESSGSAEGGR